MAHGGLHGPSAPTLPVSLLFCSVSIDCLCPALSPGEDAIIIQHGVTYGSASVSILISQGHIARSANSASAPPTAGVHRRDAITSFGLTLMTAATGHTSPGDNTTIITVIRRSQVNETGTCAPAIGRYQV